jgi:hypothetical protein
MWKDSNHIAIPLEPEALCHLVLDGGGEGRDDHNREQQDEDVEVLVIASTDAAPFELMRLWYLTKGNDDRNESRRHRRLGNARISGVDERNLRGS